MHVGRAWRSGEVKKHGPQFQTAVKVFAKRLVKEPDLSLAQLIIAYLSHVVSTSFVPCDDYDLESPVEMEYDNTEAESMAKTWADIVHAKARETQMLSDTDMEERLEMALKEGQFSGWQTIDKITKEMIKMRQKFALTYLSKKTRQKDW